MAPDDSLFHSLTAALDKRIRSSDTERTAIAQTLRHMIDVGRAAWPTLVVSERDFIGYVAERIEVSGSDIAQTLESLDAAELHLAWACGQGHSTAISAFEQRYFGVIGKAVSTFSLTRDQIADIKQILRKKLFVALPGQRPKILDYGGQGELNGLVRIAAVRAAINLVQRREESVGDSASLDENVPAQARDPELASIWAEHRQAFKCALEDAVHDLGSRERLLLRLYYVRKMNLERIGALYDVHLATASRWIARAREDLVRGTRKRLKNRCSLSDGELTSIGKLLESQVSLSLARLLASTGRHEMS